ncbi:hypothetical protein [Komagataeibacter oboediens]
MFPGVAIFQKGDIFSGFPEAGFTRNIQQIYGMFYKPTFQTVSWKMPPV